MTAMATRRLMLAGMMAALACPALAQSPPATMPAAEAHAKAMAGAITLVDIRTPAEWRETGLPASAHAITMNQDSAALLATLDKALGGDRSKPLALICRTGNRSSRLIGDLQKAGYTGLIDVAEGMAGSRAGPGWLKSGLPLRPGDPQSRPVLGKTP